MPRGRFLSFVATGLVFLVIGAVAVYLAITIPNDVKAETLLKEARSELQAGDRDDARQKFETVIKNHPRTDAAAAASYALFRLLDQDRKDLEEQIAVLEKERDALRAGMGDLDKRVGEASRKAEEAAAKPAPPPAKKPVVKKKPTPKRTTPTRRRRS